MAELGHARFLENDPECTGVCIRSAWLMSRLGAAQDRSLHVLDPSLATISVRRKATLALSRSRPRSALSIHLAYTSSVIRKLACPICRPTQTALTPSMIVSVANVCRGRHRDGEDPVALASRSNSVAVPARRPKACGCSDSRRSHCWKCRPLGGISGDNFDHRARVCAITHEIAEKNKAFRAAITRMPKTGIQRFQVAVDVG